MQSNNQTSAINNDEYDVDNDISPSFRNRNGDDNRDFANEQAIRNHPNPDTEKLTQQPAQQNQHQPEPRPVPNQNQGQVPQVPSQPHHHHTATTVDKPRREPENPNKKSRSNYHSRDNLKIDTSHNTSHTYHHHHSNSNYYEKSVPKKFDDIPPKAPPPAPQGQTSAPENTTNSNRKEKSRSVGKMTMIANQQQPSLSNSNIKNSTSNNNDTYNLSHTIAVINSCTANNELAKSQPQARITIEERKKRIDDEIKRRIEDTRTADIHCNNSEYISPMKSKNNNENLSIQDASKDNNNANNVNSKDAQRFKYSPKSTEKSRTAEMRQRLNLEKRLREEKINKYNELLERYKKKG